MGGFYPRCDEKIRKWNGRVSRCICAVEVTAGYTLDTKWTLWVVQTTHKMRHLRLFSILHLMSIGSREAYNTIMFAL